MRKILRVYEKSCIPIRKKSQLLYTIYRKWLLISESIKWKVDEVCPLNPQNQAWLEGCVTPDVFVLFLIYLKTISMFPWFYFSNFIRSLFLCVRSSDLMFYFFFHSCTYLIVSHTFKSWNCLLILEAYCAACSKESNNYAI